MPTDSTLATGLGSIGLEDELVDTDGDGADEEGVKLLVVLITGSRNIMLDRADPGTVCGIFILY